MVEKNPLTSTVSTEKGVLLDVESIHKQFSEKTYLFKNVMDFCSLGMYEITVLNENNTHCTI